MTARSMRLACAAAAVTLVAACEAGPEEATELDVVATTSILGDVTTEIVGDAGTVETLIPTGADPHEYQASASQAASVRDADLVISNGLGLEEGLEDVVRAASEAGVPVLELAPQLDPIDDDPHVWLDPLRIADGARLIGDELNGLAENGPDWSAQAESYAEELESLHDEAEEILSAVPADRRQLVTDHDSLRYFAQRYEFTVLGTIVPGVSPLAAPTAQRLNELASLIEEQDVPAIFLDVATSDTVAQALRREAATDIEIVRLHIGSLGEEGSAAATYEGLVIDNAGRIADALGG
ncbi:MAG: metal ABC transporter solute-binding protein, Zn/Mn family [Actinomycetota bacterium]